MHNCLVRIICHEKLKLSEKQRKPPIFFSEPFCSQEMCLKMGKSLIQPTPSKAVSILHNLGKEIIQKWTALQIQENYKFSIAKTHIYREQLPDVLKLKKVRFKRNYSEVENYAKIVTKLDLINKIYTA